MGGRAQYSPIPTQSELREMKQGGATPKPQSHITQTQIQTILNAHVNNRPDADDMAKPAVVDIVKNWVNKNNDTRVSVGKSSITEGNISIGIFQDKKSGQWFARQR